MYISFVSLTTAEEFKVIATTGNVIWGRVDHAEQFKIFKLNALIAKFYI
jgi:hypothetical protein